MGSETSWTDKHPKWLLFTSLGVTLAALAVVVMLSFLFYFSSNPPTRYMLTIDCGWDSTTFNVYSYTDYYFRTNAEIKRVETVDMSGIREFVDNLDDGVLRVIRRANATIVKNIPKNEQDQTRIFLGIVDGDLTFANANLSDEALLTIFRQALSEPDLIGYVAEPLRDVQMILGNQQSIFAWMATNYVEGRFQSGRTYEFPFYGTIDADASSARLTLPFEEADMPGYPLESHDVFGQIFRVFNGFYPCSGFETLRLIYLLYVISINKGAPSISSPCHLRGYEANITTGQIFNNPCIVGHQGELKILKNNLPSVVLLKGDYFKSKCRQAVTVVVEASPTEINRPRTYGPIAGVGWLSNLAFEFEEAAQKVKVSKTVYIESVDNFCKLSWVVLPPDESVRSPNKCLYGWLGLGILEAFGFENDSEWRQLIFLNQKWSKSFRQIKGNLANWQTGYALEVSKRIPSTGLHIYLEPLGYYIGLGIAVIITIIFAVILIRECCRHRRHHHHHH